MANHELNEQLHNPPEGVDPTQEIRVKFEEGRFVYADVPLHLLETPGIPVDQEHVEELAEQMRDFRDNHDVEGGNGQREEVLLAQVEGDDDKLHIIEGLHRIPAIEINGDGYARCKVLMGSNMEEVAKMRMSGVKEHPSIRTARSVRIIDELWQFTKFSEKYPRLTSSQAFSLTNDDRSGKELGISSEDVKQIKEWATDRAEECNLAVTTVDKHLRLIDAVDPEIIQSAREMHGKKDSPYFAAKNLKWLAKHLRGEFDKQKVVVSIAIANNLNSDQVEELAQTASEFDDMDKLQEHIAKLDYGKNKRNVRAERARSDRGQLSSKETKAVPKAGLDNLVITEIEVCNYALENTIYRRDSYLCLPNNPRGKQPINLDADLSKKIPDHFFWSAEAAHDLVAFMNELDEGIASNLSKLRIGSRTMGEDQIERIISGAKARIAKDLNGGVIRYTGVHDFKGEKMDKKLVKSLLMRCVADNLERLREAHNNGSKKRSSQSEPQTTRPATISVEKYRQALSHMPSTVDRKILTLSTVFDIPAFAIAQVVRTSESTARNTLANMSAEFSRKK